jgi:hypothetical protein
MAGKSSSARGDGKKRFGPAHCVGPRAFVPNRINEYAHAINFKQGGGATEPGNAQAGLWACCINSWIGVKRAQRMPGRPPLCWKKGHHYCSMADSRIEILESTTLDYKPTCGLTGRKHLHTYDDDLDLGRAAVDEEFDAVDET